MRAFFLFILKYSVFSQLPWELKKFILSHLPTDFFIWAKNIYHIKLDNKYLASPISKEVPRAISFYYIYTATRCPIPMEYRYKSQLHAAISHTKPNWKNLSEYKLPLEFILRNLHKPWCITRLLYSHNFKEKIILLNCLYHPSKFDSPRLVGGKRVAQIKTNHSWKFQYS